jgi:hypothetical protein
LEERLTRESANAAPEKSVLFLGALVIMDLVVLILRGRALILLMLFLIRPHAEVFILVRAGLMIKLK